MFLADGFYIALLAVFAAGVFRGFSGFGVGMILVPILSLLYNPKVAVVTVVLLEIIPAIQLLPRAIANCHWQSIIPMSLTAMLTIPFGSLLLVHADADSMRSAISILVILCVLVIATGWRYKGEYKLKTATLTGMSSGLISGATSLGGLPVILYYLSGKQSTEVARASIVIFLVITSLVALVTYSVHGLITADIVTHAAWFAPLFIVAIWQGSHLFGKVSEPLFRAITLILLGSVGFTMLLA